MRLRLWLVAAVAIFISGASSAASWTVTYESPPWRVFQNASAPEATCMAANTLPNRSAALMILGRKLWAQVAIYSPAWSFPKTIGESHLLGYKDGTTLKDSEYNGQYVYVWTGDDPQAVWALVIPSAGNDLVITDMHGGELASFPMPGYEAAYKAFATCIYGRQR